jgi:predicted nucleic acid-binding protein
MLHYFVDTSFFIAIENQNDKYHIEATKRLEKLSEGNDTILTTSDYVLDEFFQITKKVKSIEKAILWSYKLTDESFCNIYYCNQEIFLTALELFRTEIKERKPMSFTDCVIYVSHSILQCDEILTFDKRLKNY